MATDGPTHTRCAIVGGGPAGMVLGLLLARAGVDVTVLEKHADFLRDFRGDTVHPSTIELLHDLGLGERFDAIPHGTIRRVEIPLPDGSILVPSAFDRLRIRFPYVALVPQWDLLELLADAAESEPTFTLRRRTEVTGLTHDAGGRVTGVEYTSPDGDGTLEADLVIGSDGRWSVVRRASGLTVRDLPVDMNVWWFKVPTASDIAPSLLPRIRDGRVIIAIPREGYLQVGYLGLKGQDAALRGLGIEAFREQVAQLLPEVSDGVAQIASMDDVKELNVVINRLPRWHKDGLLCIGDAAHAMSPSGGVGINLAVQDAVATARILAGSLADRAGPVPTNVLARVQMRRWLPTVLTQGAQRFAHRRVIEPMLNGSARRPPAAVLRVAQQALRTAPGLAAIPAYLIGVGVLPERAPAFARRSAAARQCRTRPDAADKVR